MIHPGEGNSHDVFPPPPPPQIIWNTFFAFCQLVEIEPRPVIILQSQQKWVSSIWYLDCTGHTHRVVIESNV